MQIVCKATQSSSVQIQVAAFECLVRIMSLYYDKMGFYMERALFGVRLFWFASGFGLTFASVDSIRHEAPGRKYRLTSC